MFPWDCTYHWHIAISYTDRGLSKKLMLKCIHLSAPGVLDLNDWTNLIQTKILLITPITQQTFQYFHTRAIIVQVTNHTLAKKTAGAPNPFKIKEYPDETEAKQYCILDNLNTNEKLPATLVAKYVAHYQWQVLKLPNYNTNLYQNSTTYQTISKDTHHVTPCMIAVCK